MLENEPNVRLFLDEVCQHVRAKELHPEIREEISGHIEDRAESLQLEGYSKEDSIREAVKQMGSSEAIGQSLDHAHRPIMNWGMLVIIGLMAVIGILAALSVQYSGSMDYYFDLFVRKAFFTGVGLLALVGLYFSDYRKILKYADTIFLMTLCLMVFTILNSTTVNGSSAFLRVGPLNINTMGLALLLLLMSLSGMKSGRQLGWLEISIHFLYRGAAPVWLFSKADSLPFALIYVIGYVLITWHANKNNMKQWIILGVPLVGLFGFILFRADQVRYRISAFFKPTQGEDYLLTQTTEAIRAAGWTGRGFAAANEGLPYIQSVSLFPYLIYCFGWGIAIIIGLLVLLFLMEVWRVSTSLHDKVAQRVIIAFTTVLAFQMLWPILMAFGMVPFTNMELPFISFGGSTQILYFAAMGMVLSMYRRKNMLPSTEIAALNKIPE